MRMYSTFRYKSLILYLASFFFLLRINSVLFESTVSKFWSHNRSLLNPRDDMYQPITTVMENQTVGVLDISRDESKFNCLNNVAGHYVIEWQASTHTSHSL